MPRNERRTEILDAVIRIAASDGFAAATVRRVGAALGMSSGNVHHLFSSAAELKREAFRLFAEREVAALDASADKPTAMERLHAYIAVVATGTDISAQRIWTSAGQEAARDEDFAALWDEMAEVWLNRISELLINLSGHNAPPAAAKAAAWRLMSYSIGILSFSVSPGLGIDEAAIHEDIRTLIAHELDTLRTSNHQPA